MWYLKNTCVEIVLWENFDLSIKNCFQRIWPVFEILSVCLSNTFKFFRPHWAPGEAIFIKFIKSIKSFVSSIIWFQSRVFSSIRLEVMKGQRWSKNCWILPFSHLEYLEHGQNKVAMAFRQCPMIVRDPRGPLGAAQSLKTAKKCFKSSHILLSTYQMSNTVFSHSKITI